MASKTHTAAKAPIGEITPIEWYDELMKHIEPDLVSTQLPLLDQKYNGETAEQRADRLAHYKIAFMVFNDCAEEFAELTSLNIERYTNEMLQEIVQHGTEEDFTILSIAR